MKKIISQLISVVLVLITVMNILTITSTADEKNDFEWSINANGELTVKGSGAMPVWESEADVPWYDKRENIKSVVIGENITDVGEYAFSGCENLQEVILSKTISDIGDYSFFQCKSLVSIIIPESVSGIGQYAFYKCGSLTDVVIPDTVKEIEENAFAWCDIKQLILPEGTETIGKDAFYNNRNLYKVSFPPGLKNIEERAFLRCSEIEELILPDGLREIGEMAFSFDPASRYTIGEQKIYIPQTVEYIAHNAFSESAYIYGYKDSQAHSMAKEEKIRFEEITESMYSSDNYKKDKLDYINGQKSEQENKKLTVKYENGILKVIVNDSYVQFTEKPFIDENDRTQIPVRAVMEEMGCNVTYDNETVKIKSIHGNINIIIKIGDKIMRCNGQHILMDTEAQIINDTTYIPVRFAAEALGYAVNWS